LTCTLYTACPFPFHPLVWNRHRHFHSSLLSFRFR
jgi:hypothetical protein